MYVSDSDSSQEVDSIAQQPVFDMGLPEGCSQSEVDAVAYLTAVRKQRESLPQNRHNSIHTVDLEKLTECSEAGNSINRQHYISLPLWIASWRQETVTHWWIVVENVKYISALKPSKSSIEVKKFAEKINLSQYPLISELVPSLTLPTIESLIYRLSYQFIEDETSFPQYALWIYSLLALHKHLAQYTIFEALGSVSMCLSQATKWQTSAYFFTILTLMVDVFSQKHQEILFASLGHQSNH